MPPFPRPPRAAERVSLKTGLTASGWSMMLHSLQDDLKVLDCQGTTLHIDGGLPSFQGWFLIYFHKSLSQFWSPEQRGAADFNRIVNQVEAKAVAIWERMQRHRGVGAINISLDTLIGQPFIAPDEADLDIPPVINFGNTTDHSATSNSQVASLPTYFKTNVSGNKEHRRYNLRSSGVPNVNPRVHSKPNSSSQPGDPNRQHRSFRHDHIDQSGRQAPALTKIPTNTRTRKRISRGTGKGKLMPVVDSVALTSTSDTGMVDAWDKPDDGSDVPKNTTNYDQHGTRQNTNSHGASSSRVVRLDITETSSSSNEDETLINTGYHIPSRSAAGRIVTSPAPAASRPTAGPQPAVVVGIQGVLPATPVVADPRPQAPANRDYREFVLNFDLPVVGHVAVVVHGSFNYQLGYVIAGIVVDMSGRRINLGGAFELGGLTHEWSASVSQLGEIQATVLAFILEQREYLIPIINAVLYAGIVYGVRDIRNWVLR